MTRGRKVGVIAGGLVLVAAAVATVAFGFVGVSQTVESGTQARVCGVTIGVTVSDQRVRLLGASDESFIEGDRVRVAPFCVVEVVAIEETGLSADADGSSARVELRWRLW